MRQVQTLTFAACALVMVAAFGTALSAKETPALRPVSATALSKGEQVAIAGDCAGCHGAADRSSGYSGGVPIESPMGEIYARNITPDPQTGIGNWSYDDFVGAMRHGKSKTLGNLYPAMPYTSYKYMTEEDMRALFDFLHNEVKPVRNAVPESKLGLPFVRPAMGFWNLMYANTNQPEPMPGASPQVQRGKYLVETLGHCGECHTPRGMMMQSKGEAHRLSGGAVGGWYAPNITSDASGVGKRSPDELRAFLMTGKTNTNIAGGDMGAAIEHSLSKMPASDIDAMVAFLLASKPVKTGMAAPVVTKVVPVNVINVEPVIDLKSSAIAYSSENGEELYIAACATCHGVNGEGVNGSRPSLVTNGAVRASEPHNVVQSIAKGINLASLDKTSLMPGFRDQLNDGQIAALTNYVRQRFGGIDQPVSASEVASITSGKAGVSWLLRNARGLSWIGVAAVLALIAAATYRLFKRRRRTEA